MHWIKALQQNDRKAQFEVYQRLSPKLYGLCFRYLNHEVEVEEAISDTFVSIFKNIDQLQDEEKFEAWAKRIAVNKCLEMIRKKKIKYNTYLDDLVESPKEVQTEENFLLEEDLLRMLQFLPEGSRTIFNLYVIEGYTHIDIAKELGVSVGTSKSQLNAARKKLQKWVNQHYFMKAN